METGVTPQLITTKIIGAAEVDDDGKSDERPPENHCRDLCSEVL